jgi:hypothetical protein
VPAPTAAVDEIRRARRACPHRLRPQGDGGELGAGAGGGWPWLTSWRQAYEHLGDRRERTGAGLGEPTGRRAFTTDRYRVAKHRQAPEMHPSRVGQPSAEHQLGGRSLLQASDQRQLERIENRPEHRAERVPATIASTGALHQSLCTLLVESTG